MNVWSAVRCAGLRRLAAYAVRAQFELHVHVALVFEAVLKVDDVGVLHRLVDLDLREQLQTRRSSAVVAACEAA